MTICNNSKVIKYSSDPQITYVVYAVTDAQDKITLSDDMILVSDIENKYVAIGYALATLTYTKYTDVFIVETIFLNEEIQGSKVVWQAQARATGSGIDATIDEFFENS